MALVVCLLRRKGTKKATRASFLFMCYHRKGCNVSKQIKGAIMVQCGFSWAPCCSSSSICTLHHCHLSLKRLVEIDQCCDQRQVYIDHAHVFWGEFS